MDFDPGMLSDDEEILADFADELSGEEDPRGWDENTLERKHAAEEVEWRQVLKQGDEDDSEQSEEKMELDSMGNPIFLAAAVGLGYEMAQEEIDERQIAEDILKDKARRINEPKKVPLSHRHKKTGGHMTPFARWATKVNLDHSKINDDIEYTKEEQLQIFKSEGDWDG